ncbi:HlyD family type I secretion periplasmic adaptor subunit [Falsigemmobacter faecalis]|uniref:Membrane fusion protein (MFP) family protein n=1 Tax=Falsigemmobacter faecalis TaxID=2488730 RepID=A0A3P3DI32_9RHOB|nr:HlyD family type I secretion periplasmic adaptor subunit [Falsigemmobacter faecalis]RRH73911.1 HlyD family type I secretion periplasmic adaptor subunit [Falsigemmobacter faecalis]
MTAPPWSARRQVLPGLVTVALLFAGSIAWGMMTRITGAIVASGRIEVAESRQILQHPEGGMVVEILVREGDAVTEGQVLLRLDGGMLRSELAVLEAQYFELLARRGRLEAEEAGHRIPQMPSELQERARLSPETAAVLTAQTSLFEARRASLTQQRAQLNLRAAQTRSLREGLVAQTIALEEQSRLIGQELRAQQDLFDKGLAQIGRLLALRREAARLSGARGELLAAQAQAGERIAETALEVLRLDATRRTEAGLELRETALRLAELSERRRSLTDRIARLDLRAPAAGLVLNLAITTPRAVLRAAEPALYIVPQDRPLVISARVPDRYIDQVYPGQEVRITFPAFTLRNAPQMTGTIARLSADALSEANHPQPYYRAEITLHDATTGNLHGVTLRPGMPADAWIRTEERTPLQFLIRPFTDYFTRAFRES